jgi:hypothetical protein
MSFWNPGANRKKEEEEYEVPYEYYDENYASDSDLNTQSEHSQWTFGDSSHHQQNPNRPLRDYGLDDLEEDETETETGEFGDDRPLSGPPPPTQHVFQHQLTPRTGNYYNRPGIPSQQRPLDSVFKAPEGSSPLVVEGEKKVRSPQNKKQCQVFDPSAASRTIAADPIDLEPRIASAPLVDSEEEGEKAQPRPPMPENDDGLDSISQDQGDDDAVAQDRNVVQVEQASEPELDMQEQQPYREWLEAHQHQNQNEGDAHYAADIDYQNEQGEEYPWSGRC